MKTVIGFVVAAVAASACCLGPVVFSLIGAGALGAAAVTLEPLRPLFLVTTGALLVAGFYMTYRGTPTAACGPNGTCHPSANRVAETLLWVAAVVVILIVTFSYYMNWLV